MTTRRERLDRLAVGSECEASWESMEGDGCRRFCAECRRHVLDFAQLTAVEIETHLRASRGRLCARLTRRDGRLVVAPPMQPPELGLPPRRRPGGTLAAGLVGAWLGAAAAAAAPARTAEAPAAAVDSPRPSPREGRGDRQAACTAGSALRGRVAVADGPPLQGARLVARNALDGSEHSTLTRADGTFAFTDLPAGIYDLDGTLDGYTIELRGGIVLQPGEQRHIDLTALAHQETVTAGVIAAVADPLRQLFERSELVVAAVAVDAHVVAADGAFREETTRLRIETILKGAVSEGEISHLTRSYVDAEQEADGWTAEYAAGTRVLAFLEREEDEEGEALGYVSVGFEGLKRLDGDERAAYLARLDALARVERRAQRRGESDPADLVEWLVATVEDPVTRAEGTGELGGAIEALAEQAKEGETSVEVAAADLLVLVDRFRGEGGRLSQEPPAAVLGAFLSPDHRERLTAALAATDGLRAADLDLFRMVIDWDRETALRWLVRELRGPEPGDDADLSGALGQIAEKLGDGSLEALVEATVEREIEIWERWSEDESEATLALREQASAELIEELRRDFAEALAASVSP